jgi:tetraacyldisaccharide 4'-kinase
MSGYPVSWVRVTSLTVLLIPLSWLYRLTVALRRTLYRRGLLRSVRLPVPVIVVGNISVGGTGKTPLVLWIVERLRVAGYTPGIVSRGYGAPAARGNEPRAVGAGDDAALCGDEPVLLARRSGSPVWIGADRIAAARALLASHPACDVIVSDDGLQHYRLARDAEVAVIDAARGHGNGFLLPAGPLREPPSRLDHVDAVVIRGDDTPQAAEDVTEAPRFAMAIEAGAFYNLRDPRQTGDARRFREQRVHAAAGIGNPEHFFNTLKSLGLAFTAHPFPDHHPYTQADLAFANCDAVVMTEKDAVKYERYATKTTEAAEKYWALGVAARVDSRLASLLIERINPMRRNP